MIAGPFAARFLSAVIISAALSSPSSALNFFRWLQAA
jgi:hypothetical protein